MYTVVRLKIVALETVLVARGWLELGLKKGGPKNHTGLVGVPFESAVSPSHALRVAGKSSIVEPRPW